MTYKLLAEVNDEFRNKEALTAELVGLEASLQAAIDRYRATTDAIQKANIEQECDLIEQQIYAAGVGLGTVTIDKTGHVRIDGQKRMVIYDHTAAEKGLTRVYIRAGRLSKKPDQDKWVTTSEAKYPAIHLGSAPGFAMYVMSGQGHLHLAMGETGYRHHSSLLAGANTAGAGMIKVDKNGYIQVISNDSGHYEPDMFHFIQVLHELAKRGVPTTFTIRAIWQLDPGQPTLPLYSEKLMSWNTNFRQGDYTLPQFLERVLGKTGSNLGMTDLNEQYAFNNLAIAYKDFVNVPERMKELGYEWCPLGKPPFSKRGAYMLHSNIHVPSQQVRHEIKNAMDPGRLQGQADPRLPKQVADRSGGWRPS